MWILGIETSGRGGEVALLEDDVCRQRRTLQQAGRRHAQTLALEVRELLREFNLQPADCEAAAVSIGPGSFTGLRVGVVFAKTWAYATGCALAAVDTFQAIAVNSPAGVTAVSVIADAQRGDLYVSRYQREAGDTWRTVEGVRIRRADDWLAALESGTAVSGPGVDRYAEPLAGRCRVLDPPYRQPRADVVARLGLRQIAGGHCADPWRLEPFYLRKSAAEEKWVGK